jgi:phthiocerol/phenolphthiocerol synthesis type-I polyketide synthase E
MLDPAGRVLVRIVDFTVKRINDIDGLRTQIERFAEQEAEEADASALAGGALRSLSAGMSADGAVAAFARILAAPSLPEQLLVTPRDLPAMRRLAQSITPALLVREVEHLAPLAAAHPRPDLATPYVAPATDEERAVAAIWQEVLGVDRVGVHDDFFALGGHSLAAVQIGAKLRSRFGAELDLRSFFDTPTVAHAAAALAGGAAAGGATDAIKPLRRDTAVEDPDEDPNEDPDGDMEAMLAGLSDDEVDAQLRQLLAADATEQGGPA